MLRIQNLNLAPSGLTFPCDMVTRHPCIGFKSGLIQNLDSTSDGLDIPRWHSTPHLFGCHVLTSFLLGLSSYHILLGEISLWNLLEGYIGYITLNLILPYLKLFHWTSWFPRNLKDYKIKSSDTNCVKKKR